MHPDERRQLARAIEGLEFVTNCTICHAHAENPVCGICSDSARSDSSLCVVAESRDISTIEATNVFRGKYFVLGGTLNPIAGQTPERLRIDILTHRVEAHPDIQEIILAFSPDVHGETTILYLAKRMKSLGKRVTRLARGLPMGADIEYADEVTLSDALSGRREA